MVAGALAGGHLTGSALGGQTVPTAGGTLVRDPANPSRAGYRWVSASTQAALSLAALGGGGTVELPATGGLTVVVDPELASIRANCWWSGAGFMRLTRIVDSVRSPVRGGFPATVITPTRRNWCTCPSGEDGTAGWSPGTGTDKANPTDPRAAAGARVIRFSRSSGAGTGPVSTTMPISPSLDRATGVSLALRLSGAFGPLTVTGTWQDQTGAALPPTSATIAAADLARHVATDMPRTPVLTILAPAGSMVGTLNLSVAGVPAGGVVDVDAVLAEYGDDAARGDYFDGDVLTGAWTGIAHRSASTLASTMVITDTEAPLDVPIVYELTADQPGYRALSEPVVLSSRRRTWLSHPEDPYPIEVWVTREPDQSYGIDQEAFRVKGRRRPVVVSGERQSQTGTMEIYAERFFERDRLLEVLGDGSPLLLRAPADHGHGAGEWLAFGEVSVKSLRGDALDGPRFFSLPYVEVDPPALAA